MSKMDKYDHLKGREEGVPSGLLRGGEKHKLKADNTSRLASGFAAH